MRILAHLHLLAFIACDVILCRFICDRPHSRNRSLCFLLLDFFSKSALCSLFMPTACHSLCQSFFIISRTAISPLVCHTTCLFRCHCVLPHVSPAEFFSFHTTSFFQFVAPFSCYDFVPSTNSSLPHIHLRLLCSILLAFHLCVSLLYASLLCCHIWLLFGYLSVKFHMRCTFTAVFM